MIPIITTICLSGVIVGCSSSPDYPRPEEVPEQTRLITYQTCPALKDIETELPQLPIDSVTEEDSESFIVQKTLESFVILERELVIRNLLIDSCRLPSSNK